MSITQPECVCVFVAFGIQHAMSNISPHYLIKGKILEKKIAHLQAYCMKQR